jgi:hypothetical protein
MLTPANRSEISIHGDGMKTILYVITNMDGEVVNNREILPGFVLDDMIEEAISKYVVTVPHTPPYWLTTIMGNFSDNNCVIG